MYAKLENGNIKYPPQHLKENGRYVANYNNHTEDLIADGWLEVVESEPEHKEGKAPVAKYKEKGGKIIQSWEYIDEEQYEE